MRSVILLVFSIACALGIEVSLNNSSHKYSLLFVAFAFVEDNIILEADLMTVARHGRQPFRWLKPPELI
jgi:hypothetical protein